MRNLKENKNKIKTKKVITRTRRIQGKHREGKEVMTETRVVDKEGPFNVWKCVGEEVLECGKRDLCQIVGDVGEYQTEQILKERNFGLVSIIYVK